MIRLRSFSLALLFTTSLAAADKPAAAPKKVGIVTGKEIKLSDVAVRFLLSGNAPAPVTANLRVGSDTTAIGTNSDLGGATEVAADNTLYVAQTTGSGTAIFDKIVNVTTDGAGLITRRARGTPSLLANVVDGDQIGYMDFRSYSGTKFFQQASISANVDGEFTSGQAPPARLVFSTNAANGGSMERMRIDKNGYVYINTNYQHTTITSAAYLTVKSTKNDWTSVIHAAPASGAGYGLRVHSNGATAGDIPLAVSSGAGAGTIKFRVNGDGTVLYGTASVPTKNSGKVFVFGDNAAPPTLGASTAAIYNNGGEMFVMNSSGTATKVSKNYDPDEAATWGLIVPDSDLLPEIEYECNAFIGVEALTYTNPATGIRQRVTRPLDPSLRQDWTESQIAAGRQREADRAEYEDAKAIHAERNPGEPFTGVKPEDYVPVDPPQWMQRRGVKPLNVKAYYDEITATKVARSAEAFQRKAKRKAEADERSAKVTPVKMPPQLADKE